MCGGFQSCRIGERDKNIQSGFASLGKRGKPFCISAPYMLDCWLWDLVDCMRHEEEKIAGNTRDRGEKQGRARIRAGYFEPALVV